MSSSTKSTEPDGGTARLPTNPRRRKIPTEQRKRTVRACNSCNIRRMKCSGEEPCSRCQSASRVCRYPVKEEKILVTKESYGELQKRCLVLERCLADAVPSKSNREILLTKWTTPLPTAELPTSSGGPPSRDEEQDLTDGRVLQDPDGYVRHLGETSGAAFIDRLREFVGTVFPLLLKVDESPLPDQYEVFTSLLGRYHTHDSKLLLLPNVDPFYLPEPEEISKLVAAFRFYAGDGSGSSQCGGIYYWGDLDALQEQTRRQPDPLTGAREELHPHMLCNLNAIMALACQYEPSLGSPWDTFPGETFFARAKLLLINPMEDISVPYMRALCLMGHYLLGLYRRDAAFMYIGLAMRISVIHGLHKAGQAGEQGKRDFWNTFILDRWLSCLMGRPATVPHESITVDLPLDVMHAGLPPATGLRAHAQLALIMDEIVNRVYGIASSGRHYPQTLSMADTALQKLHSWNSEHPPCLRVGDNGEISDRASIVLHMMYNQLIILCTRPSLFQASKQSVAAKYLPIHQHRQRMPNTSHISLCANAARDITELTQQLISTNQAAVLANVDYHFAFTAAIVLELVSLLRDFANENDETSILFLAAYLQDTGEKGNESAADCARMVREFGMIVERLKLHPAVPLNLTSVYKEPQTTGGTSPDNAGHNGFANIIAPPGALQNVRSQSNSGFIAQGQSEAFDEIFSWFIESPN